MQKGRKLALVDAANNPEKAAITGAFTAALEPLAALMIEHGISTPEAESLLRSVIVHGVHRSERAADPDKVSLSRVALLTGVHRNEVKRILSTPPRIDPEREARRHRANRILTAWHQDPDYISAKGQPINLPVKSQNRKTPNFWTLVERYAPGVWPGLILNELIRVGAVEHCEDSKLKINTRSYSVIGLKTEAIEELGHRARDLANTLVHNLKTQSAPRVCETAVMVDVDPKWIPVLRTKLQRRAKTFIAAVAEDLQSQRVQREDHTPPARIGITVYSFEDIGPEG